MTAQNKKVFLHTALLAPLVAIASATLWQSPASLAALQARAALRSHLASMMVRNDNKKKSLWSKTMVPRKKKTKIAKGGNPTVAHGGFGLTKEKFAQAMADMTVGEALSYLAGPAPKNAGISDELVEQIKSALQDRAVEFAAEQVSKQKSPETAKCKDVAAADPEPEDQLFKPPSDGVPMFAPSDGVPMDELQRRIKVSSDNEGGLSDHSPGENQLHGNYSIEDAVQEAADHSPGENQLAINVRSHIQGADEGNYSIEEAVQEAAEHQFFGFAESQVREALIAVGKEGPRAAIEWLEANYERSEDIPGWSQSSIETETEA